MSTEHDETKPVPAAPSAAPAGEPPTTPVPRTPSGRTEEPTLVFDTFAAAAAEPDRTGPVAGGPRDDDTAVTPRTLPATEPVRLDKPGGSPAAEPARTSAFAAAGGPERTASGPATSPMPSPLTSPLTGPTPSPMPAPMPSPAMGTVPGTATGPAAGTATGTATAEAPAPAPVVPVEREISSALRVGTVVWGLVLAIIGAGVIAIAAGASVDFELAAIGLLALAGVALVVGSVVSATRRKR